ncbi:reverse transcriptase domain-containing protein [Sulfobacillus harzensis]|uniref:Reverse transcriptase n=1 Tax=Sulfobacillus harzensis TaxID=2729629 RepID=A0A7Y0L936_9FIRM|nr:reverse transcriptase domain-containing protein [Sulfobacillus harzensis]NMP25207.1 reverse transcriptase [Sulfobacillus harzensis]
MLPDLTRITRKASADTTCRFTALAHYLNEEFLLDTWLRLNRRGSAGIDRQTMQDFDIQRETAIRDLVDRSRRHAYQAPPVRRVYIPKPGQPTKRRPLGIPTVADRLMQAAVARLLGAIYEADFLDSSYGFRPERSTHDALGAIETLVFKHPIHWVFEADIRGFFDHLNHQWLERMLQVRIGDPWILRLVGKWLRAPIDAEGAVPKGSRFGPGGGSLLLLD